MSDGEQSLPIQERVQRDAPDKSVQNPSPNHNCRLGGINLGRPPDCAPTQSGGVPPNPES